MLIQRKQDPRVLVTGVAGFIGSHVAANCLKQGFKVTGVDDLSGGFIENIRHIQGSIRRTT